MILKCIVRVICNKETLKQFDNNSYKKFAIVVIPALPVTFSINYSISPSCHFFLS